MSMFTERLQVLITPDQRRRLEAEADRRQSSVATVVRDAIDATLSGPTREQRRRAFESIVARRGRHLSVEEIEAIIAEERESNFSLVLPPSQSA